MSGSVVVPGIELLSNKAGRNVACLLLIALNLFDSATRTQQDETKV